MRKLLSIALIAALSVLVTPIMGNNTGISNAGLVYAAETIPIDEEHFPDTEFRDYLIHIYGSSFDPTSVTGLEITESDINSLEGLQYFPALESLGIYNSSLSSLDVSHNTALVDLRLNCTDLSSLNVGNNTALKTLSCACPLSNLDVSHNTALESLSVSGGKLNSLDLSNNTALKKLYCGYSNISSLDLSNNIALEELFCEVNNLSSLNVSNNTALKTLFCGFNNISSLDLSNNTALETLWCNSNELSSLDVSHNTALVELRCYGNRLSSLDLSNNTALETLWCNNNELSSLDLSNNTALKNLDCEENNLSSLDIRDNTVLGYLNCQKNALGKLYVGYDLPVSCSYDDGVEIIYEDPYTYGIGDFVIGRDSNNFSNVGTSASYEFNNCGYKDGKFCDVLDLKYYAGLMALEAAGDALAFTNQSIIAMKYWNKEIGGICYGTAATMSMLKSGALKIGDLTEGNAVSYYKLGSPANDYKFGQMMYYYVLSQYSSSRDLSTVASITKDGVSGFSKALVSALQNNDKPYTLNFPKHTWIATEVKTNPDGSYTVEMFDENTVYRIKDRSNPRYSKDGYFTYMSISSDFESLSFTDDVGTNYYTDEDGKIYYNTKKGEKRGVENIWICDPDKLAPEKMPMLKAENAVNFVENTLDKCDAISFWNNISISLSNSEGETMSYNASEGCISGDMKIADIKTFNYGDNNFEYIVYVPKSNSYTVNTQNSDVDVSLFSEDNIIAIKGTNINNITLDSNLNAVVEGESDGYTFDIASTVKNDNNEVGLDLINISGEASDKLKVTNSTESLEIQSDSNIDKAKVVTHSDNKETENNLDNVTTINVEADSNITSDTPTPVDPTPVDPTPVDPTPVDPTPVDPTPVDPTPVDPTPVDPTPVGPTPAGPTPTDNKVEAAKEPLTVSEDKPAEPSINVGDPVTYKSNKYKVLSVKGKTVAFTKAKNSKSVVVPASIKIDGAAYKVTQINASAFKAKKIRNVTIGKNVKVIKKNAFKGSKATKLILKTKLLKKTKVKGCLKSSKIKTVQVKVGSKKQNKTYIKKYKKIFTKANAGKKINVK